MIAVFLRRRLGCRAVLIHVPVGSSTKCINEHRLCSRYFASAITANRFDKWQQLTSLPSSSSSSSLSSSSPSSLLLSLKVRQSCRNKGLHLLSSSRSASNGPLPQATTHRIDYHPPLFSIPSVRLVFKLDEEQTILHSSSTFTIMDDELRRRENLVLEGGENLELLSVSICDSSNQNNSHTVELIKDKDFKVGKENLTIYYNSFAKYLENEISDCAVSRSPSVGRSFNLNFKIRSNPSTNTELSGLYQSDSLLCTQCEAEGFRRIVYHLDRPDVLTVYLVRLEADKKKYPTLLSNGNCIDRGDLPNGRHFTEWLDPFPKPSYLFALVAGDLVCLQSEFITKSGRIVKLGMFSEREGGKKVEHEKDFAINSLDSGRKEWQSNSSIITGTTTGDDLSTKKLQWAMQCLKVSMKWDETTFNLECDLDEYNVVAVNNFNMGAMENKGLNIFLASLIIASPDTATDTDYNSIMEVVAHEYFHNYTGNRVTCLDWFQLTLKEGLTVFRDQWFSSDQMGASVKRINDVRVLFSTQFPEDAGPLSHPIRPDSYISIDNFYTSTVYRKGAEIVRIYKTLYGTEGFKRGLSLYLSRHDGSAATCSDFLAAMRDANSNNDMMALAEEKEYAKHSTTTTNNNNSNNNNHNNDNNNKDQIAITIFCPDGRGYQSFDINQMELWYSQKGTPIVKVDHFYDSAKREMTLRISQSFPYYSNDTVASSSASTVQSNNANNTASSSGRLPVLIPVQVGLIGKSSRRELMGSQLLVLDSEARNFVFKNVAEEPVVSIFRDFSAPVDLEFDQSDEDLAILMGHDTDGFNQWNSGQRLVKNIFLDLCNRLDSGRDPVAQCISIEHILPDAFVESIRNILKKCIDGKYGSNGFDANFALVALSLQLPDYNSLFFLMTKNPNIDTLVAARKAIRSDIAKLFEKEFLEIYYKTMPTSSVFEFSANAVGMRQLNNLCLSYLNICEDDEKLSSSSVYFQLALNRYYNAVTMTERLGALSVLTNRVNGVNVETESKKALSHFYSQVCGSDALIKNKWFAIQASADVPDVLDTVKALIAHPDFRLTTPACYRAVINSFSMNTPHFHNIDGSGYDLVCEMIAAADKANPQLAARAVLHFTTITNVDSQRRKMMKERLERLLDDGSGERPLSKDTFENVSRILGKSI